MSSLRDGLALELESCVRIQGFRVSGLGFIGAWK